MKKIIIIIIGIILLLFIAVNAKILTTSWNQTFCGPWTGNGPTQSRTCEERRYTQYDDGYCDFVLVRTWTETRNNPNYHPPDDGGNDGSSSGGGSNNPPQNNIPEAFIIEPVDKDTFIENENIIFRGQGVDQDGFITEYKWYIDDSFVSSSASFTKQLSAGEHIIKFKVKDNNNDWSPYDSIQISVNTQETEKYTLRFHTKPTSCKITIQDVNFTNMPLQKISDADGLAVFTVEKGTYIINISKQGYISTEKQILIDSDKSFDVTLRTTQQETPGFELLSLLTALGIAFIIIRKK